MVDQAGQLNLVQTVVVINLRTRSLTILGSCYNLIETNGVIEPLVFVVDVTYSLVFILSLLRREGQP